MKTILITFPTSPKHPYIHKNVAKVQWLLSIDKRYNLFPIWPSHNPYEVNLNEIVIDFVNNKNLTHWLNIDADNPPLNNPLDLVELDKDIIGLPTPIWHCTKKENPGERPIYWSGYDYIQKEKAYKEHSPKAGLQPVDAFGTGCFIISKRVFINENMQNAPFLRKFNKKGQIVLGNDLNFCEKARKEGFEVWMHYDYPCDHFNELPLNEVIWGFKNLYENNKGKK